MIIVLTASLVLIILNPAASIVSARNASAVWAGTVMPALFPYMVLTQLLTQSIRKRGVPEKFALPVTVLLGMLGGSPSGAKLLAIRCENAQNPPRRLVQAISAAITTASPMFMIASLPAMLGGTAAYDGIRMFAAHILANILAGLILFIFSHRKNSSFEYKMQENTTPAQAGFFDILKNSAISMLAVCGGMIIFSVLTSGLLSAAKLPDTVAAAVASMLEMAGGCARIAALPINTHVKAALMCAAATFGGMSIFMQNAAYLGDARVNMGAQLAAKALAGVAAFGLTVLFYMI